MAKRSYEIVYTAKVKVIREADTIMEAINNARANCPKGFTVSEVNTIKSRDYYRSVKNDIANQFEIPILIN